MQTYESRITSRWHNYKVNNQQETEHDLNIFLCMCTHMLRHPTKSQSDCIMEYVILSYVKLNQN